MATGRRKPTSGLPCATRNAPPGFFTKTCCNGAVIDWAPNGTIGRSYRGLYPDAVSGTSPMDSNRESTDTESMNPIQTTLKAAEKLALATPPERNRYVDLLRALSILVVVFGHWLMAAPEVINGEIRIGHALTDIPWTRGLTWVLQVMPIFFFVGGYSNALGLRAARRKAIPYGKWLRDRLRRLIVPVLPVLVLWAPAAWLAVTSGVDTELVKVGSQAALVPV